MVIVVVVNIFVPVPKHDRIHLRLLYFLENSSQVQDNKRTMAIHILCFQTFLIPKDHNTDGLGPENISNIIKYKVISFLCKRRK